MFSPTLIFGFIIATLWGALFHLIMGGDIRRFALFLLVGWIGFGLGQIIGIILEINLFNVGSLHIVSSSLGAFTALIVAYFLTRNSNHERPKA